MLVYPLFLCFTIKSLIYSICENITQIPCFRLTIFNHASQQGISLPTISIKSCFPLKFDVRYAVVVSKNLSKMWRKNTYKTECKHMICMTCHLEFLLSKWPCRSGYGKPCKVAGRQTILPSKSKVWWTHTFRTISGL